MVVMSASELLCGVSKLDLFFEVVKHDPETCHTGTTDKDEATAWSTTVWHIVTRVTKIIKYIKKSGKKF